MSQWKPDAGAVPLFVHVAVGVFLGVVAAAFVIWRVALWRSEVLVAEAAAALEQMGTARAQEQQQSRDAVERQEQARRVQAAATQHEQEAARRRTAEEVARRETAWAAFYRKSPACDEARGGAWTVDCANEFIRAKKRFTELYDAGRL